MNLIARLGAGIGALLLFAAVGTADAARKPKDLLQYIPADTPYVFALTKPLPRHLQDRFEPAIDKTLAAYRQVLTYHASAELETLRMSEDGEAEADRLQALVDEVAALLSVEELRKAGLGRGSLFAIYGDGLLPVMRIALTDADAFDDAIARMETAAEASFETGSVQGTTYRYRDFDKMRLIIATLQKDAVITLAPASYDDARLAGLWAWIPLLPLLAAVSLAVQSIATSAQQIASNTTAATIFSRLLSMLSRPITPKM